MRIEAKTKVHEALKLSIEIAKIFSRYKLDCPRCKGSSEDTIEKVAINNGLDLEKFLKEVNGALSSSSSK